MTIAPVSETTSGVDALLLQQDVSQFLAAYQRTVDEHRYLDWLDLFVEDGAYSVIDAQNAADHGMFLLYDDGLEARKERCGYLMGYWKVPRSRTSHFVSNIVPAVDAAGGIHVRSKFTVFRTDREGVTRFHACGDYEDDLVRVEGGLKFQRHHVVLDMNVLPDDFTPLL